MTKESVIITRSKEEPLKGHSLIKKEKQPKLCRLCGFLVLSTTGTTCCNCKRFDHASCEDEVKPKLRPFDFSYGVSKSVPTLDDFLRTSKFVDYLKNVNKFVPLYLQSAHVIKSNKDEALYSVLGCLKYEELTRHLMALRIEHIQKWCRPVVSKLMIHPKNTGIFNIPVDAVALGIPHYHQKIRTPMDLGTIRSRLQRGYYDSATACMEDIALVFKNAMLFNPSENYIHQLANALYTELHMEIKLLDEKCAKEAERKSTHSCQLCLGSCCPLCGEKCLKFESPVLVCHGPCNQRIKKNTVYFVTPDATTIWCQKCYSSVSGSSIWTEETAYATSRPTTCTTTATTSAPSSSVVAKRNVLKRRTDEEVAEPWVSCDTCGHWVHQICALYCDDFMTKSSYSFTSLSTSSSEGCGVTGYQCPLCRLEITASAAVKCESTNSSSTLTTTPKTGRGTKHTSHLNDIKPVNSPLSTKQEESKLVLRLPNVKKKHDINNTTTIKTENTYTKTELSSNCVVDAIESKLLIASLLSTTSADIDLAIPDIIAQESSQDIKSESFTPVDMHDFISDGDIAGYVTNNEKTTTSNGCPTIHTDNLNQVTLVAEHHSTLNKDEVEFTMEIVDAVVVDGLESEHCDLTDHVHLSSAAILPIEISSHDSIHSINPMSSISVSTMSTLTSSSASSNCIDQMVRSHYELDSGRQSLYSTCHNPFPPNNNMTFPSMRPSERLPPSSSSPSSSSSSSSSSLLLDPSFHHWTANRLPRTKLSDFMESMVRERLIEAGYEDIIDTLTVRMTSNCHMHLEIPEPIINNMMNADGSYLTNILPYKQKCILLFQKIDGVDICLFCLYVQEFDKNCPPPNSSVVYIAYLDSIDYLRPLEARTLVYHEIMVSYLKWAQMRGFRQGHIWACPPQRGDNFIFWCHPPHQRTPSRERLNSWYQAILARASKLGIVDNITNLWSENFACYGRRDKEDGHQKREAAKNSLVGAGHLTHMKTTKKGKSSSCGQKRSVDMTNLEEEQKMMTSTPAAGMYLHGEEVPICPPIFEGEYWVSSCMRIHQHVQNRHRGSDGKNIAINQRKCRDLIKSLMGRHNAYPFNQKVDPVALGIPEYPTIIQHPMDLGTIRDKLRVHGYHIVYEVIEDVRLTFNNAMLFNPPLNPVHLAAKSLLAEFERNVLELVHELIGTKYEGEELNEYLKTLSLIEEHSTPAAGPVSYNATMELQSSNQKVVDTSSSVNPNIRGKVVSNMMMFHRSNSCSSVPDITCSSRESSTSTLLHDTTTCCSGSTRMDGQGLTRMDSIDSHAVDIHIDMLRHPLPHSDSHLNGLLTARELQYSHSFHRRSSIDSTYDDSHHYTDACTRMSMRSDISEDISALSTNSYLDTYSPRFGPTVTSGAMPSNSEHHSNAPVRFDRPQLGFKGAMSMMAELSKAVMRLKDDLFLFHFSDPNTTSSLHTTTSSLQRDRSHSLSSTTSSSCQGYEKRCRFDEDSHINDKASTTSHLEYDDMTVSMEPESSVSSNTTCQGATIDCTYEGHESVTSLPSLLSSSTETILLPPVCTDHIPSTQSVHSAISSATTTCASSITSSTTTSTHNDLITVSSPTAASHSHKRGRRKSFSMKGIVHPRHMKLHEIERDNIPENCLYYIHDIVKPDTSDPDDLITSPFVDSRHTFLEMCQYRHYQFDTLRRAKHSSLMLLYHLHHPHDMSLRPTCYQCKYPIRDLRWHCDACPKYDVCDSCYGSGVLPIHEHLLTPFRVTYH